MADNSEDYQNIDFNFDWEYYSQPINEKTEDINDLSSDGNNHRWLPLTLPHRTNPNSSCIWWYRKKFHSFLSQQQSAKKIYLKFEKINHEDQSNLIGSIWINERPFISNQPLSEENSFELTERLYHYTTSKHIKNTIIICSKNQSLDLNIHLIICDKFNSMSKETDVVEKITEDKSNRIFKKQDSILSYTVRLKDDDGRIGVRFNNYEDIQSPPAIKRPSESFNNDDNEHLSVPYLSIVILIVGTRGDVQPFIALGKSLLAYGHRVRLATHEAFRSFVRSNGLEFYPLAGDPSDLMSFMVKNAGIIPSMSSIVQGDVSKHRRILSNILNSTWLACTAADDETSISFTAEAIIANPPSFGHIHCAEKLQIPLHIMFTMPYSPTTAFPHPFCTIDSSIGPTGKLNYYSYHVVELLTWSGMHKIINHFRRKILGLPVIHMHRATSMMIDEHVPHTYCWSKALVPKPADWSSHINVSGFFFLNLGSNYTNPPSDLIDFLGINDKHHKLSPPIYIGFGSITGHDSRRILEIVLDALKKTGYRALLSGLAADNDQLPDYAFRIDNVPHDWLFQYVSVVCHHGGAGTTAAGLRAGKPTIIVPFFGDQYFWGNVIEESGAGPSPLPGKSITVNELAEAFRFAHQPTTRIAAENIQLAILNEDGCQSAVDAFHAHLPLRQMHSDLQSKFAACYRVDGLNIQISRPVAQVLVTAGLIDISQLRSHHTRKWKCNDDHHCRIRTSISSHLRCRKSFTSLHGDNATGLIRSTSSSSSLMNACNDKQTTNCNSLKVIHPQITDALSLSGERLNYIDHARPPRSSFSDISIDDNGYFNGAKRDSESHPQRSRWHSRKIGLMNLLKRSCIGRQDECVGGKTAEALIVAAHCAIEPAVATLPKLSKTTLDTLKEVVSSYDSPSRQLPNMTNVEQNQEGEYIDVSPTIKAASVISGYSPKECQDIIHQFEKIKMQTEETPIPRSSTKRYSKHKFEFQRQRSHSTPDLT